MRIGIVNDLELAVKIISQIVTPRHQVAWVAHNGREAVDQCIRQKPDIILMDLFMPIMDGVDAIRIIMHETPCPILVVTASVEKYSSKVFEAIGAGALDVVATPVPDSGKTTSSILLQKIEQISLLSSSPPQPKEGKSNLGGVMQQDPRKKTLVVIGCSTGGPDSLLKILKALPEHFPAGIVAIQHMDSKFTPGLAHWLNNQCDISVRLLKQGDRPEPGVMFIPSTNDHCAMFPNGTLGFAKTSKPTFYHPSVDIFFKSVAEHWYGDCIGVLLTGMGKDGAEGLLRLRQRGFRTIAQDEASSVVFGMPRVAIEIGAAMDILPISEIGPFLIKLLASDKGIPHGKLPSAT